MLGRERVVACFAGLVAVGVRRDCEGVHSVWCLAWRLGYGV